MSEPIQQAIQSSIEQALPGAIVQVDDGGGGHYSIMVTTSTFEGKTTLQRQRAVYQAIAHLMQGDNAPVHAVDRLHTIVP